MTERSLIQYLVHGSIWAFLGKLVTALMSFFMTALLARILSPEDIASFFLANSLALFIALTGRFGLDNTLLHLVSESLSLGENNRAKTIILMGILIVVTLSVGLAFVLYIGLGEWLFSAMFPSGAFGKLMGVVLVWAVALSLQFVLAEIFRALKEINIAAIVGGALTAIISVILVLGLWLFQDTARVETILALVVAAVLLNVLSGLVILYVRLIEYGNVELSSVSVPQLFHSSWPFWINAVTHFSLGYSGLWILGYYATGIDVALYGAANRLIMLVGMSLVIVNSVVPPLIARLNAQGDVEQMERIIRGTGTISSIPAILIITVLLFFSDGAMTFAFGVTYVNGSNILQILLIGQFVGILSGSCGYLLMMTGNQKTLMYISIISALLSVVSALSLIKPFGVAGVAWAGTITIVFQQIATVIFARRKTGVWSHFSVHQALQFAQNDIRRVVK